MIWTAALGHAGSGRLGRAPEHRVANALSLILLPLVLLAAFASAPATARGGATPSVVTPWIQLELETIAAQKLNPPRAARALAHVSAAMHLAARFVQPGRNDAVVGAAATVAAYLHPEAVARVEALAAELADTRSRAFARGRLVGQLLVARAGSDRSNVVWAGAAPTGDGYWLPTPPASIATPLEPLAGTWRTWNLTHGAQFRPGPPLEYGSAEFLTELREVWEVSAALTAEQKQIAAFWADGPGTVTPPGHWNQIALGYLAAGDWSTRETTRLFAALNTAQADAFIACWDAKFAYWSLRPVTAMRRLLDPAWLPLIATPPFPSYVSGHATTSGAASTVLARFFPGQRHELTAMAEQAALSRLYGGIHYRSDNSSGLELGRQIGAVALRAYGLATGALRDGRARQGHAAARLG